MPPARIAPSSPRVSDRTGIRWPASSGGGHPAPPEEDVDDGPHAGIPRPRTAVRGLVSKRVQRPDVRDGYDRWSESYDQTPNPLVALDRRHTVALLRPRRSERILDAGCGTGAHLGLMLRSGSFPVGLDLSRGMLRVTRAKHPSVPLAQADLNDRLPVRRRSFDAVLCALVGEHLSNLRLLLREVRDSLLCVGTFAVLAVQTYSAEGGIRAA